MRWRRPATAAADEHPFVVHRRQSICESVVPLPIDGGRCKQSEGPLARLTSRRSIELVEPADLVRAARTLGEDVFVDEYGHSPWLAVRLPTGDEEMASALRVGSRIERFTERPAQPIEFNTDLVPLDDLKEMEEPSPPSKRTEPDMDALRELIGGGSHFRALRKRLDAAATLGDRVSIGRAMNQDIVLRHPRVSKFHGFFQATTTGYWWLCDAGSKNGTRVNGVRLAPRKPLVVTDGDRVTFGSIETAFLDASTVWRLLRTM